MIVFCDARLRYLGKTNILSVDLKASERLPNDPEARVRQPHQTRRRARIFRGRACGWCPRVRGSDTATRASGLRDPAMPRGRATRCRSMVRSHGRGRHEESVFRCPCHGRPPPRLRGVVLNPARVIAGMARPPIVPGRFRGLFVPTTALADR